ncbi:MAG: hypothetical protein ACSLE8_19095 [Rhodococcus sp. (in: high G+C Gram-positive bacteria)]
MSASQLTQQHQPTPFQGELKSPSPTACDVFKAGLVADVGVECEGSEEFSGVGVDDSDVEVVDEENDGDAFVLTADGDVVHAAGAAD